MEDGGKAAVLLGAAALMGWYALRPESPAPRRARATILPPPFPKGSGPWRMKEAGCHRDVCTFNYQNPHISPTGWLDVKVEHQAYERMPANATLAKLKKVPGFIRMQRD